MKDIIFIGGHVRTGKKSFLNKLKKCPNCGKKDVTPHHVKRHNKDSNRGEGK